MTTKLNERYKPICGTDHLDIIAKHERFGDAGVILHSRVVTDVRAQFAMACIEKWAMVAAEPDGEDSGGRLKVRRMTPSELVEHACQCSETAFKAFADRGWSTPMPPLADIVGAVQDEENAND